MKLDFSKITDKVAVWCDTEDKAKEFIKQAYENGYSWQNDEQSITNYDDFKEDSCYRITNKTILYCGRDWYYSKDYTIIPFNDLIIKEKPLSDWTLGEVKAECKRHFQCDSDCICYKSNMCNLPTLSPKDWNLQEKPHFTAEEIEKLKAIKVLYPDVSKIVKVNENTSGFDLGKMHYQIPVSLSLFTKGETINIDEVLEAQQALEKLEGVE